MAGTIAAAVHIFTIIGSLRSTNPDTALARLFIPSPGKVDYVSRQPMDATLTSTILPPKYQVLLERLLPLHAVRLDRCGTFRCCLHSLPAVEICQRYYEKRPPADQDCRKPRFGLPCLRLVLGPEAAGPFALAPQESTPREQDVSRYYQ
jgi:hypothetical protein